MRPLVVFSPAKLNLFLAVTGRRPDGYHSLVSLVSPLDFGDTLTFAPTTSGTFNLTCDHPDVPVDQGNLVLRAARAFAARTGWRGGADIALQKRIPVGAGLGGGSSNAVATLRGLNELAGQPLGHPQLLELAAGLGSDCPLFLHDGPVVMRGRGERIEPLPAEGRERLLGCRVLVFKPAFAVATPWAYGRLAEAAARPEAPLPYLPEPLAEERLAAWLRGNQPVEDLLFNSLEAPVFEKFVPLPTLLSQLQRRFGWTARMSGSGSACFGILREDQPVEPLQRAIREAWGDTALQVIGRLGA